ncbi:MAG: NAD(P)/FAD-dependent oxidoreductase, partial [Actinomycetota bacterium]
MTSLPASADTVVVGAGLAGLSAARRLQAESRDVVVLEASDGVGGRVRTDEVDGFRLDRGFQVLLTAYPELERQFDVEALDLRYFEPGARVWDGQNLHTLGDPLRRPGTMASSALAPVGTPADKLRLLRQRIRLRRRSAVDLLRQPDTTTRSALEAQGFSEEMVERFFTPFVGGIQLDPTLGTSRRVFDVVLQSLYGGGTAVPAAGMGALSEQLAGRLHPGTVHLDTPVTDVTAGSVTVGGDHRIDADHVVVAVEGPVAAALLDLPPVASNPATCVWLVAPDPPTDDRFLVLDGTGAGPARNVAVMTNVAPEYAPDRSALVAAACPAELGPYVGLGVGVQHPGTGGGDESGPVRGVLGRDVGHDGHV